MLFSALVSLFFFADMDESSQALKYFAFLRKYGPKGGIRWSGQFAADGFSYVMGRRR